MFCPKTALQHPFISGNLVLTWKAMLCHRSVRNPSCNLFCLPNLSQEAEKALVSSKGKCAQVQEKSWSHNKCIYLYPIICWDSNMLITSWA